MGSPPEADQPNLQVDSNSNYGLNLAGPWGLFLKDAIPLQRDLSNAPVALNKRSEQAEKASVATENLLWGCPITNFKATLPFNRMKQVFAAFKKRPRGPAFKKREQ